MTITRKHAPGFSSFYVYSGGHLIDVVYFRSGMTTDDVRRSLIGHDGYDRNIVVRSYPANPEDRVSD